MFETTLELAENKLLLLYILKKIKLPMSNNQITEVILENNILNYFVLQQYISELLSSSLVKYIEQDGKHRLTLTEKGDKVLSMFLNRISPSKLKPIENYLDAHIEKIKNQLTVFADYTIENSNNYIVNLKATENDSILIDLKLNVSTNEQAKELCYKWKNNCSEIYGEIIKILINN